MIKKNILLFTVIILAIIAFFGVRKIKKLSEQKVLKIWSPRVPFSLDPLEYDALAHHICFRSVYSTLVSDYKLGEIKGVIASKWEANADKTIWTFQIRDGLTFSDGKKITSQDVALSLNRAALLMKKANSESGLLENLKGIEKLEAADSLVEGISVKDHSVSLSFKKPLNDVLEKIGFGLYAIVSPVNYDSKTGEWLNKKSLVGSGPYVVGSWTDSELELKLRSDYQKELLLEKPITRAVYRFSQEAIADSDIVIDFDDSLSLNNNFTFHGPVKSAIRYIQCESWQNPKSVCHDRAVRKSLRNDFYARLSKEGFSTIKSFLPLAIKGATEFSVNPADSINLEGKLKTEKVVISKINPAYKSEANKSKMTAQEAFDTGMKFVAEKNHLQLETFTPDPKAPLSGEVDFRFRMTAILVDSPNHDIMFMVNSDHGIKLPDENGEIKKYIADENFSALTVNKMLWDQAIIWPVGHMALGIWKKEHTISFSSYNLILPPLDLQWIEWE